MAEPENEEGRPVTGGPLNCKEMTHTTGAETKSNASVAGGATEPVAPVVWVVQLPHGRLKFYCDHCRGPHFHGGSEGHRVAHCFNPSSPFKVTGYRLRLEGGEGQ